MEELWSYDETIEYVEEEFNKYFDKKGNYKFTIEQTIAKLLYEYENTLKKNDTEAIMIYIEIAKNLLKHDSLIEPIKGEILVIQFDGLIEEHKSEFQGNDYELVKAELENIIKEIEK